jgi:antitoxin component YwqK of YwqJK toxin-antitoxin module
MKYQLIRFIFCLIFLPFVNICKSQKADDCNNFLGYDSTYTENFDTIHYNVFSICKINNEIKRWSVYKKTGSNDVPDGPYKNFKNGVVTEEGCYLNGDFVGNIIRYFPNHIIKEIIQILNDSISLGKNYFKNGNIMSSGSYQYGKETHFWYYYHDNGQLMNFGNYIQIEVTDENVFDLTDKYGILTGKYISLKDGKWKFFSKQGMLEKEEIYEKGKLIKTLKY